MPTLLRRFSLGLILSALLAGAAQAGGLAFVIDSNDAAVSVVDVATHKELRRVPVLREPHHMALTPDGKSLLIGDTTGNALFFLDPDTGREQRRITISDPYQLQFSPDGKWLTVAGLARNQVDIYDAATYRLVHRIPASAMPSHINYAPDSATVFVSLQRTNRLMAIAVKTGQVLWDQEVGRTPAGVLWHDGRVLVGDMGSNYVAVVNPTNGHVERKVVTGRGAHNLFVSPDGKLIYVTNRVEGTISVLDAHSLAVLRSFRVPGGPDDLDFGPDGKIWATQRWAHAVAVIDPGTGAYSTIEVGRSPHGIWLNTHQRAAPRVASLGAPARTP